MKVFNFDYKGQPVRVLKDEQQQSEWFLFNDIASILDLTPEALSSLDSKEKRTVKPFGEPEKTGKIVVSLTGLEKLIGISERKEISLLN